MAFFDYLAEALDGDYELYTYFPKEFLNPGLIQLCLLPHRKRDRARNILVYLQKQATSVPEDLSIWMGGPANPAADIVFHMGGRLFWLRRR